MRIGLNESLRCLNDLDIRVRPLADVTRSAEDKQTVQHIILAMCSGARVMLLLWSIIARQPAEKGDLEKKKKKKKIALLLEQAP